jgi:hypothetical protein
MSFVPPPKTADSYKVSLQLILWVAGGIFLVGLVGLVVSGWYARYLQDDYCFDFLLKHHGFWNAQVFTFFNEITFNGNRFSTNLVMGLLAQIGPLSARLLPGFLVLTWLAAAYWLMMGLDRILGWRWPRALLFFLAASLVFFSLVQAPNLFQVLFWRPGSITYLMPLVLLTFSFALALHFIENSQASFGHLLMIGLFAFLVGGFSETAAAFLVGLLIFILLWILFGNGFDSQTRRISSRIGLAAILGALFAILVLVVAPSARLRQAALFPYPPQLMEMIRISLDSIRQFLLLTLYRLTLPILLGFLIFFYIGFGFSHFTRPSFTTRKPRLWINLLLTIIAFFFLLICIAMPSAYASSSIPEERVLIWARFTLVVFLIFVSLMLGNWAGLHITNPKNRRRLMAGGFSLGLVSALLIFAVPAKISLQPAFPEIRDWLQRNPLWIGLIILNFFLLVFLAGRVKIERRFIEELVPFLLVGLILLACLGSLTDIFSAIPGYQLRAGLWDWRNGQIRTSILRGKYEIEIPALDSVAGITELQANPGHWVNNCAELYYGMKSIRAVPPVLTELPSS